MIVAFYSFKGGVGRSMAMVNIGEILADWGYRVVLCDWDLEAPGLERYLVSTGKEEERKRELEDLVARRGLMDLLQEYKEILTRPLPEEPPPAVPATHAAKGRLLLPRPSALTVPVSTGRPRRGSLRLLTAGKRDGQFLQSYAEAVRTFDWDDFYAKWAGDAFIDFFRQELLGRDEVPATAADVVLIDSRTGVTEQGGVCTHHLADLVVLFSAANSLNLEGTRWMAQALRDPGLLQLRGKRPLTLLPVAARIEQTAQKVELVDFRRRFRARLRKYAPRMLGGFERFALDAEIPYMPFYSFKERVVAREPKEQREHNLYAAYLALADAIVRCGVAGQLLPETDAEGRVAREARRPSTTQAERIEGTTYLAHDGEDRAAAAIVARGLTTGGVRVCADVLSTDSSTTRGRAGEMIASTGLLLLVGSRGLTPALRAQLDYACRRQVMPAGFRLLPLLLPAAEREALAPPLDRLYCLPVPADLTAEDEDFFGNVVAELENADTTPPAEDALVPFLGAASFTEEQARFFFGRDLEVAELVKRLGQASGGRARWLQVEGASGVGKSSLALAGLVPAARRGWFPGGESDWLVAVYSAGPSPAGDLAAALARAARQPASAVAGRLLAPGDGLRDLVRELVAGGGGLLLVIDQLEEMLHAETDDPSLAHCEALLLAALDDPDLPFFLISTLRSDFQEPFRRRLPLLQQALERQGLVHQLGPLNDKALLEAVTGPAKLAGVAFESGLAERIVRDLGGEGTTPALLGLVLHSLWLRRSGRLLTHEMYDALGGLEGILLDHAERLLDGMRGEEQGRVRSLLLRLVSSRGAPLVVSREEAVAAAGGGAEGERLLATAATAQLATVSEDRVALAHAALVSWPRLARWVEEEREALQRREELEAAAAAWGAAGQPAGGLPSGAQLAYFSAVTAASQHAQGFLAAARQTEEAGRAAEVERARRSRRARRIAAGAVAAVALLAIAGGVRVVLQGRNEERSRALAGAALSLLSTAPVASLVLAIEAGRMADTSAAKDSLAAAVQASREHAVLRHGAAVTQASFSPDGRRVVTASGEMGAIWHAEDGRRLAALEEPMTRAVFSPDGRRVLSVLRPSGLIVWGASAEEGLLAAIGRLRMAMVPGGQTAFERSAAERGPHEKPLEISFATFSPDGRRILAVTVEGAVLVLDPELRAAPTELSGLSGVLSAAFSPDGERIVAGGDGKVSLWNLRKQQAGSRIEARSEIVLVTFTRSGREVAGASTGGPVLLWDLGSRIAQLEGHEGLVTSIAFSPDDKMVITAGADGTARLWATASGYPLAVLRGHVGPVLRATPSPDGRRLVTAGADGTVRLWDAVRGEEIATLIGHRAEVTDAGFSPDGRYVVSASADETARIWHAEGMSADIDPSNLESLLRAAEERLPSTLTAEERNRILAVPFTSATAPVQLRDSAPVR